MSEADELHMDKVVTVMTEREGKALKFTFNVTELADAIGYRAVRAKGQRATALYGSIVCEVVDEAPSPSV